MSPLQTKLQTPHPGSLDFLEKLQGWDIADRSTFLGLALSLLPAGRCCTVDVRRGESLTHLEMNSVVGVGSEVSEERDCRENIRTGAGPPLTLRGASQQGTAKLKGLTYWGQPGDTPHPVLCSVSAS